MALRRGRRKMLRKAAAMSRRRRQISKILRQMVRRNKLKSNHLKKRKR